MARFVHVWTISLSTKGHDHCEWYNVLGMSSIQCTHKKNVDCHYCKKYSLLGQSDSIKSTKRKHACCGGWADWWKQWWAYIYSNATSKYNDLYDISKFTKFVNEAQRSHFQLILMPKSQKTIPATPTMASKENSDLT